MSGFVVRQTVGVQVIRKSKASNKAEKLSAPIVCPKCGNKRVWVIRCEYCGHFSEVIVDGNQYAKNDARVRKPQRPIPSRTSR